MRAEVNLEAQRWIRQAAQSLERGFLVLVDYGYQASELYSAAHAGGTLTTFRRHLADARAANDPTPAWLTEPGSQDLTTHVDLTTICRAAEEAGLVWLGTVEQMAFLAGIAERSGIARELEASGRFKDRLALKTLLMPGGLGTTHAVMVFSRGVAPVLMGLGPEPMTSSARRAGAVADETCQRPD